MKILLIEDDATDVEHFHRLFHANNEIHVAHTAAEAIAIVNKSFDAIVVDYVVPGTVEDSLVDTLKAMHPSTNLIILSGCCGVHHSIPKSEAGYERLRSVLEDISNHKSCAESKPQ